MRLVANTAKHAEGDSAECLNQSRPDLFKPPDLPQDFPRSRIHVDRPLAGRDLYVTPEELRLYFDALEHFWSDLSYMFGGRCG